MCFYHEFKKKNFYAEGNGDIHMICKPEANTDHGGKVGVLLIKKLLSGEGMGKTSEKTFI